MARRPQQLIRTLFFAGLILLIVALAGGVALAARSYPKQTLEQSTGEEDLVPPTWTPSPTAAPPTSPSTHTHTPSPTPTATSPPSALATAIQASTIFAAPDDDSSELSVVQEGEQVPVLGRSAIGQWFYVRNTQGVEGFVYAPRFEWSGDYESLAVKTPTVTPAPPTATVPAAITPGTSYPPLQIDLWDLPGTERCSGNTWYKTVYIRGQGGDGVYTYYWNGEKLAGPLTEEGHTFDVNSPPGAVVGTGKVVSGDGQTAEKDLYIRGIDCGPGPEPTDTPVPTQPPPTETQPPPATDTPTPPPTPTGTPTASPTSTPTALAPSSPTPKTQPQPTSTRPGLPPPTDTPQGTEPPPPPTEPPSVPDPDKTEPPPTQPPPTEPPPTQAPATEPPPTQPSPTESPATEPPPTQVPPTETSASPSSPTSPPPPTDTPATGTAPLTEERVTHAPPTVAASTGQPPASPSPIPSPPPQPTPIPKMMIEAEWPGRMEMDASDYIRISLVRTEEGEFIPTVEVTGHTAIAATPRPVGTPEAPIEEAFGAAYKASAVARLEGANFEINALETGYQSLDQDRITWDWNISPLKPGEQTLNARIVVRWEPVEGDGDAIERTIWRAPLPITIETPWLKRGQLNILSLTSGVLGSVFSAPWMVQKAKEKRKKSVPLTPQQQLAEARENLRLIQERKSQYVLETDVPLQLIKEERRLLKRVAELELHIEDAGNRS